MVISLALPDLEFQMMLETAKSEDNGVKAVFDLRNFGWTRPDHRSS